MSVPVRRFVAIDFETGDAGRDSACAVALVLVEDGMVVRREARLIRPPRHMDPANIAIHGLTEKMVAKAPSFAAVWKELAPMLEETSLFVAHNAPFDRSVLETCCREAGIARPDLPWACTLQLTRETWPAWQTHRLDVCCRELGIELQHHDALSDALACADLYMQAHGRQLVREAPAEPAEVPAHVLTVHADNGAVVFVCRRCGMPERFQGYALDAVIPGVARRHTRCSGQLAPAHPAAAPVLAQGQTGRLFGEVAAPARRRGR